ncbi:hypothetical protein ES705_24374 [subsurface metagenome]
MFDNVNVLTHEMTGSGGVGVFVFAIDPLILRFSKAVRIIGVQLSSHVKDSQPKFVDAAGYIHIQRATSMGQATGSFGGSNYKAGFRNGKSIQTQVWIDIPADTDITINGACYLMAASGSPVEGYFYVDLIYQVKQA